MTERTKTVMERRYVGNGVFGYRPTEVPMTPQEIQAEDRAVEIREALRTGRAHYVDGDGCLRRYDEFDL